MPVLIGLYVIYVVIVFPLCVLLGFLAAALAVPLTYVMALVQVLGLQSPALPPSRSWPAPPVKGEPAVPGYFHGVAAGDLFRVVEVAFGYCRARWSAVGETVSESIDSEAGLISGPPVVGAVVGGAIGTVFGGFWFVVAAAVHAAVVAVSVGVVSLTGLILRGVDSGLLRLKNVRMVCPHCFERVPYPAYVCAGAGCGYLHQDVRPGRYGVIRRICDGCGTRLPTLLLFGSARLEARCPHQGCGRPLEHRPGEAPEIVLPFFGAAGAGKTRLLYGIVRLLRSWTEQGALTAEFADRETERSLDGVETFLEPGRATPKTTVDLPRGQIIRITARNGTRILHLFDAAGERFYLTDTTQELRYLDKARTFLLVIDPLSVPGFWDRLTEDEQDRLTGVRSAAPSPDLAYQQTHQEMEAMGVRLSRARLAVAFSRADLLDGPDDPEGVESWAREELGLGNLLRSMRHNFGEIRFFRTAAVTAVDGSVHRSVGELTRWLLYHDGIDLPGDRT
jgi:hypothetical protein